MIQSVEEMSHFTKVLLRIMAFLISISIVLCCTVLGFLMQNEEQSFPDAISFAVVLLVASIPMAMEVVTTTTMAIGSHTLSHAGAIVARLSSIEELAGSASAAVWALCVWLHQVSLLRRAVRTAQ